MPLAAAGIADLHDLLAAWGKSHVPRLTYLHLAVQVTGGAALVARDATGKAIAIGGVIRVRAGRPAEVWIYARPGNGPALASSLLGCRRWLNGLLVDPFDDGIVARVRAGNASGERMVRALGFRLHGDDDGAGTRIWRLGR